MHKFLNITLIYKNKVIEFIIIITKFLNKLILIKKE